MNEFVQGFIEGLKATSLLEWIGTITAVLYVIFAAKKQIVCWLFAFMSSSIFVYLCIAAKLYVESVLNLFYVAMAVVGFIMWHKTKDDEQQIITWKWQWHLINILASLAVAIALGYTLTLNTDQANPFVDSFTTVFALAATYMVSKKELNNWIYWIVIDAVSIYLYTSRDLELVAVLNICYTILATYAWFQWRKLYKLQEA